VADLRPVAEVEMDSPGRFTDPLSLEVVFRPMVQSVPRSPLNRRAISSYHTPEMQGALHNEISAKMELKHFI
jgi:hypothetical protein